MSEDGIRGLEHAWRYFALHAEQRMTVFNFYVASAGLTLTGLAWTLADGSRRWPLGAAAGVGAAALSFVFWRLDQRGSQLVKAAEDALVQMEAVLDDDAAVIRMARSLPVNRSWTASAVPWTFGRSFRLLFAVVSLLGIAGAATTTILGLSEAPPKQIAPVSKAAGASVGAAPSSGPPSPVRPPAERHDR